MGRMLIMAKNKWGEKNKRKQIKFTGMSKYTLGVDYGTDSVRTVLVDA